MIFKKELNFLLGKFRRLRKSLFGVDGYPSLWFTSADLQRPYKLAVPSETTKPSSIALSFNEARIRFWTTAAQKHRGFTGIYNNKAPIFDSSSTISRLMLDGTVKLENFLDESEFEAFSSIMRQQKAVFDQKFYKQGCDSIWLNEYAALPNELYKLIALKVNELIHPIFEKNVLNPTACINYQKSGSNSFRNDCTSYWHADRFVPCLNAQYYPFGCDWMPLQRIKMSAKIPSIAHARELQYHYLDINDCPLFHGNDIISQLCSPNTLYLSWHHIMHRRSTVNAPGERFTIFLTYYNSFTRKDLLKSAVNSFF